MFDSYDGFVILLLLLLGYAIMRLSGMKRQNEVLRSHVQDLELDALAHDFCNECFGPYRGDSEYDQWLLKDHGGHSDTCRNRHDKTKWWQHMVSHK